METKLDSEYWTRRYKESNTGWDIGYPAPPLTEYFDQLENKDLKILIPGCGNAYEGSYLHEKGFTDVWLADVSPAPRDRFLEKHPGFPPERFLLEDFFDLDGPYDLIVEQTFFCALEPHFREDYAQKMLELLEPGGKLVGVLFDDPLFSDHPPYGGNKEEYLPHFKDRFEIETFETAYNSIEPRSGRELFIKLRKPAQ